MLAIDAQYSALSTRVVELQRSPFAKMKRIDVLEEKYVSVYNSVVNTCYKMAESSGNCDKLKVEMENCR